MEKLEARIEKPPLPTPSGIKYHRVVSGLRIMALLGEHSVEEDVLVMAVLKGRRQVTRVLHRDAEGKHRYMTTIAAQAGGAKKRLRQPCFFLQTMIYPFFSFV